jgi:hypothetical protein
VRSLNLVRTRRLPLRLDRHLSTWRAPLYLERLMPGRGGLRENGSSEPAESDMSSDAKACAIETILRSWLTDPDLTLFCGHWNQGGIMEILPRGGAYLSEPRYETPFDGLRELRLDGGAHHIHLDLRRLTHAWYVMAPSVCYGFRPSFELRLTVANSQPRDSFGLGLALTNPYAGGGLRTRPVRRYLERATEHFRAFPEAVSFLCDRPAISQNAKTDWRSIESLLTDIERTTGDLPGPLLEAMRESGCTEMADA